jgi:MoaA/NifB/PqqE/SkfB family radical SAM enzyme
MPFSHSLHYLSFAFGHVVLGRRKPLVAGVPLTDACNLSCQHCVVANQGRGHYRFETVRDWIELFYRRGARILYLQGGEAFAWKDGQRTLDDVVRLARSVGYFKVAAVTNGTWPIETEADLVWVSIDGTPAVHDRIRGDGVFAKVAANLEASAHPRLYANLTVNRLNQGDVEAVAEFVASHPKVRGLSINFHTPYPGVEDLALSMESRAEVIDRVLRLKKQGYPIVNSTAGLRLLKHGRYRRPISTIQMVERGEVFECCWGRGTDGVCDRCGYGVIAELSGLLSLRPASLVGALALFRGKGAVL